MSSHDSAHGRQVSAPHLKPKCHWSFPKPCGFVPKLERHHCSVPKFNQSMVDLVRQGKVRRLWAFAGKRVSHGRQSACCASEKAQRIGRPRSKGTKTECRYVTGWNENRLFWNGVSLSCVHRLRVLSKSPFLSIPRSSAWASSCTFVLFFFFLCLWLLLPFSGLKWNCHSSIMFSIRFQNKWKPQGPCRGGGWA